MKLKHQAAEPTITKPTKMEPMAEAIIPLRANKQRDWGAMKDEELVKYAEQVIKENKVRDPNGLNKADLGLYSALQRRGLLGEVRFQTRREIRDWGTDEKVLEIAKKTIEEKMIRNPNGLKKADEGLYHVLVNRKLLRMLRFEGEATGLGGRRGSARDCEKNYRREGGKEQGRAEKDGCWIV